MDTALIIESIWPGYDLRKAKTYLYTCLSYLRKSFQDHDLPMRVEKSENGFALRLNGAATDVHVFEKTLGDVMLAEKPDKPMFDKLDGLYRGEYMEGCDYSWAVYKQAALNAKYLRALRSLYRHFRRLGDTASAEDCLRRVLTLAPDSEADGRELIRLLMDAGDRSEALRVYRQLEQVICEQLGIELEEETIRLYRQIRRSG